MISRYLTAAALVAGLVCSSLRADPIVVIPGGVQLVLFSKIWTLDRSFHGREPVKVAVVYQSRNRESFRVTKDLVAAGQGVAGLSLHPIDIGERALTAADLAGVDVVYVTPLRAVSVGAILDVTRAARIRTITAVPDYVAAGVAVGISIQQGRAQIIINLPAARAEGSDFSSQLLKLARVIQ